MEIVFDIEASGLNLPQYDKKKAEWMAVADRVWCICLDAVEGEHLFLPYQLFSPGTEGMPELGADILTHVFRQATTLIGHNIIGYDLPLLKRLYGWEPDPHVKVIDTLVLSRLLNPDRGSHSLAAWGERLGYPKGEYEDWSRYTPEMLSYCQRDVELTRQVYLALLEEMGDWDWSEAIELEHRFAQIMQLQEENGVYFDMGAATVLEEKLTKEIGEVDNAYDLPGQYKQVGTVVSKPFKINGEPTHRVCTWFTEEPPDEVLTLIRGPFTKVERVPLNLGSVKQVKDYLLTQGWEPTQWNTAGGERSSPKLTEDSFGTIEGDFGQKIKRRAICAHRLSQLQGWIKNVRPDGRISAAANTIGTNTGRCRHRVVVNVPAKRAAFGQEMRSLFCVPEGYVMVGHDADQIELRMLAHYMGDEEYIKEVLNGDIHTHNQSLAGLSTRDAAKSFIYAFIYGAGDAKLGQLAGGSARKGRELRSKFLRGLPALKRLIDQAKLFAERGYFRGLDGRKIWMRRDLDTGRVLNHKALNTILQCADSVVMKKSAIILDDILREESLLDVKKVIDMHDEAQAEVLENDVEMYSVIAEHSLELAGEHFELRIPLAGSATAGKNWFQTH